MYIYRFMSPSGGDGSKHVKTHLPNLHQDEDVILCIYICILISLYGTAYSECLY